MTLPAAGTTTDTLTAAFIGLGAMGTPMAAQLARHMPTLVWNRTPGKAEAHAAEYGSRAASLEDLAGADFIFSCLPTSAEVDIYIDQLLPGLRPSAVWIDCVKRKLVRTRK